VLLATHVLPTLTELCHRVVRLDEGRVVEQGEPEPVLERYVEDLRRTGRIKELRRLERAAGGRPAQNG
jgi:ABC-type multidrug transport system ATPase subunit